MNEQELMKFVIERSNDPIIKNPVLRDAMNKDLGPRNMAQGGRIGYADKNAGKLVKKPRNLGGEIANTKDAKFKSIMGKPELVEVAEAYFPEKNSKNVNWDKVLTIRERTNINTGNYTLEKAKKFITNEDIAKIKKELTKEEFAKLDFDSVVHNISNRRRAGWLGISSQKYGDATKLRQKVARVLDGRGLKNPEREAGIKKRTADLLKRNNLINEMITENKPLNIMEMTKKIGLNDRGEYIKNYVTDTFGQKKLFKIFPNQRIILEKNVNRLANSKPVLKFLEDGTLLDKKNIQYIAKNFFNNDADLAGRTLFHMAEAAKGEKAYMKNLKLDNLKPFKKQINEIIIAAENDIFGNPAGNMSRARKERVLADQIGEGSQFFRDSRTNLNKVSKEVFDEFDVKGIGTAVDELATITVPYKFGSPGYSVYQQQLTKTGDKVMDDMNMVKAKRLDRSLVDIRKALSNGTATQDMVDIYNEKVSAIASDINKDVPKNGKRLQPFLIELGGDPRKTVFNFKTLAKQNPLAAQSMLETAKTQGWSGVIPADVPTIYDLRDTDNVKKEMTNSLQSIFKEKSKNKLKNKIKRTPIEKIQKLFRKFGPRFVEAPIEDNRMLVAKGGEVKRTGFKVGGDTKKILNVLAKDAKKPGGWIGGDILVSTIFTGNALLEGKTFGEAIDQGLGWFLPKEILDSYKKALTKGMSEQEASYIKRAFDLDLATSKHEISVDELEIFEKKLKENPGLFENVTDFQIIKNKERLEKDIKESETLALNLMESFGSFERKGSGSDLPYIEGVTSNAPTNANYDDGYEKAITSLREAQKQKAVTDVNRSKQFDLGREYSKYLNDVIMPDQIEEVLGKGDKNYQDFDILGEKSGQFTDYTPSPTRPFAPITAPIGQFAQGYAATNLPFADNLQSYLEKIAISRNKKNLTEPSNVDNLTQEEFDIANDYMYAEGGLASLKRKL